jgi:preprotein translocase subunit SecA
VSGLEILNSVLKMIFGSRNERVLKRYRVVNQSIEALEETYRAMSEEDLRGTTQRMRERLKAGETPVDILPDAFAALREASRRAQAHRHFPCQLIGGQVLYGNCIAEMRTGEGKTIVCHLATYLKVIEGNHVHIVTVNDYLVKRDADFALPIFALLGVTVGYIQSQVDPGGYEGIRQQAYACDVTYGTNNEFGFDYLRDNMKMRFEDQVQGRLHYAIVDEVDSILIDEARTPLIISGPATDDISRYKWADNIARFLIRRQKVADSDTATRLREWGDDIPMPYKTNQKLEDALKRFRLDPRMLTEDEAEAIAHKQYFVVQEERKAAHLTHEGVAAAQDEAGIGSFYIGANMDRPHIIENALRAHLVYERDKAYVVQNREVIIVDEFTGRLMIGRQWSDGLHQAVEAKESVPVKEETQTLATITIQNFFKLYKSLAGMTGTAMTESEEFMKIYRLDVVEMPTNRPVNRVDHNDKMYRSVANKYNAMVNEIQEYHRRGRPSDPFLLADLLKALKPIQQKAGQDTAGIEEALKRFTTAEEGDQATIRCMLEVFDEVMGDLAKGRPILVGTTSVENSEKISGLLERTYGIEHEVLNAKNHAREAEIVAKAGFRHPSPRSKDKTLLGNVTIATNMAGRGTDIKLEKGVVYEKCVGDLAPREPGVIATKCCIHCDEYDSATNCAHCFKPKIDPRFPALGRTVCTKNSPCGLHIVGTERHEARRIDNQLRGRSGRQGDPGSSRFFLSLEDDLLKLFMPDWMLRMMERLGLTEGSSLEDRSLTKGIERAQRKVEERNFSTRKHLLEWDEPMDYQRKSFYSERQQILEGGDLDSLVWRMIDDSLAEAVNRYLAEDFRAKVIAEWCRSKLDLEIEPEKIDITNPDDIQATIRRRAQDEARDNIQTNLGEYIDEEEPAANWDLGGLLRWAQRAFDVSISQNQLRKMEPSEIGDFLVEAAEKHYDNLDLSTIEAFLSDTYPRSALADWARAKFAVAIKTEDIAEGDAQCVLETLNEKVRSAYRRREIEYPVEFVLERAYGAGGEASSYAAEMIASWANFKYNVGWSVDDVQRRSVQQVGDELVRLNEGYLSNGRLTGEVDEILGTHQDERLVEWARRRFGPAFREDEFVREGNDKRQVLLDAGRRLARLELTALERYVLLRIYDQAWKDHLREMDHLKHSIMQRPLGGDQTHPQSQYAIEGREYFDEMWKIIRERVTDSLFKVRMSSDPSAVSSVYRATESRHDDSTGTGFSSSADQAAAMRAQGEGDKPKTIRREDPRIGRNQPCPCGSGKKFKNCHGKSA